MKPTFATAARIMITATMIASIDAREIACFWVTTRGHKRQDRHRDHRPERGVRSEDQDARRAEDRVASQAHDGGIQASDRRQARQSGISHGLPNQEGREHNSRDDVVEQPPAAVRRNHLEPRHPVRQSRQAPNKPGPSRGNADPAR